MTNTNPKKHFFRRILRSLRHYRLRSIFFRNFLTLLLVIMMLCIAISWLYTERQMRSIQGDVQEMNLSTLRRSADMFDSIILQMSDMIYTLSTNGSVAQAVLAKRENNAFYKQHIRECQSSIEILDSSFDLLDDIFIYSERNDLILGVKGTRAKEKDDEIWLNAYQKMTDRRINVIFQRRNDFYPYWITMIGPIRLTDERIGAVVLHMNIQQIGRQIGDTLYDGQKLYVLAPDNQMFYCSDYRYIGSKDYAPEELDFVKQWSGDRSELVEINGESYVLSCVNSTLKDWKYIFLSPFSTYQRRLEQVNGFSVMLIGIVAVLSVSLVVLATQQINKPILSILDAAERYSGAGRFGQSDRDEIESVIASVRSMQDENQEVREEMGRRMASLEQAQISILQSQIDPHFLCNALESIRWQSIELHGGDNDVADMTASLAELLRLSLDSQHYLVTLREEIRHVRAYADIFCGRYRGQIQVHFDIPEELMNKCVVKLSVQPLVENAVKHGLRPKRYVGSIWVRAMQVNGSLAISVEDDGAGMSEEQISAINASLRSERETQTAQVGLHNVNKRIKLIFGSSFGVILNHRSEGAMVTLLVPLSDA